MFGSSGDMTAGKFTLYRQLNMEDKIQIIKQTCYSVAQTIVDAEKSRNTLATQIRTFPLLSMTVS